MRRIYEKPPVIEAFCKVDFAETDGDFTTWGDFYRKIKDSYPVKTEIPSGIKFQFKPNSGAINQGEFVKRFIAEDNSQLVQASYDSFTFNRLSPYLGYQQFSKSFADALSIYVETFSPKRFVELSMRYINQIVIPHDRFVIEEYFVGLVPTIPENLTEAIGIIHVQVQIAPQIADHFLQVTLRGEPSTVEGKSIFFLDIVDMFQKEIETDESNILKIMNDAHENIDHVFESIIEEKLRELFGEKKENG
jgi:uncharacterized protein (TIGR04255 family)